MRLLAVDPGNEQSAYVILNDEEIVARGIIPNNDLILAINRNADGADHMAIEMVASYGMPVGVTIFETVLWIGRFIQAFGAEDTTKVYRKDVKMHLCGTMKAKDGNIRQALLDRYGEGGVGNKKNPGPLYGISKDLWSALAIGLTWQDTRSNEALDL